MGPHARILRQVPARLSRRQWLAALAPVSRQAWRGVPLAAIYEGRLRRTRIFFENAEGIFAGIYDHDRSLASLPEPAQAPTLEVPNPRIQLRVEKGWLLAADDRRVLRRLMPVGETAAPSVVYPVNAHPDLTALWSLDSLLFYTNHDYHNVYRLPETMIADWQKPRRRS